MACNFNTLKMKTSQSHTQSHTQYSAEVEIFRKQCKIRDANRKWQAT